MDTAEYKRIEAEIERINADNRKRQSLGGRKFTRRYTDEERAERKAQRLEFERSKLTADSHPLKRARLEQRLSLRDLSDKAIVGISTICGIEQRTAKATSRSTKLRLSAALKVPIEDLFSNG